ncbi:MAG: GDSL-type esterase/lipase family protein [Opitutus sp.]
MNAGLRSRRSCGVIALALCGLIAASSLLRAATGESVTLSASDPRFTYEGRFDAQNPAAPVIIWQASRIRLNFEGDVLDLHFSAIKGQSFFNAEVDGQTEIIELREGQPPKGAELRHLGAGRHQLVLFKRSEAAAGEVRFDGATLAPGGQALAATPVSTTLRMQFFGDSITAGACNEDGEADQWEDRRPHNNAQNYGAFTAAAFNADYRNIAVSGMGIAIGWTAVKAGEMWDRIYPRADSPRADLTTWSPDVVFINLGENDDSFTKAKDQPFPSRAYTDGYVALATAMRKAYPAAEIVILRGGMYGGAQSERLREPWTEAVTQLEKTDPHLTHFVFSHWSKTHPRVSDHRAMADELITWLRQQSILSPAK